MSKPKVKGKIVPINDKVIVCDMEFGMEKTTGGILLHSDNGKRSGIHPRWAKVFAVGPNQHEVKVGDWILLEHGRWSRSHLYETEDGKELELRLADINAMLMSSDEKPDDTMRVQTAEAGSNFNFNIPGA
jgi:co-chaperonin GroES (HSP10)